MMDTACLQVGDEVIDFEAESTLGPLKYHDMIDGVWSLLISFGDIFDPIATTEIGHLSKLCQQFEARNTRIFGIVPDTNLPLLRRWIQQVEELEGTTVNFPIIVDPDGSILSSFQRTTSKKQTTLLLCDIDKRIRLLAKYPASLGRNFYEDIRSLDALQLAFFHQVATPANWIHGLDLYLQSHLSHLAAHASFPKGMTQPRPWFRSTPPISTNSASTLSLLASHAGPSAA